MWLKLLLICTLAVVTTLAEAPLWQHHAPYAPSGWRPRHPFRLPRDYLPPAPPTRDIEKQQLQPQTLPYYQVELNKERVDFAGQIRTNTLNPQRQHPAPQKAHFPPQRNRGADFLKVQHPPYPGAAQQFKQTRPKGEIFPNLQQQQQQSNTLQYPPQFFQPARPAPVFSSAKEQKQPQQEQQFEEPAAQYGPPPLVQGEQQQFRINYPDTADARSEEQNTKTEQDARSAIEALNGAVDDFNQKRDQLNTSNLPNKYDHRTNEQEQPTGRATRGQYYVLSPDNRLQLVMYTAAQSAEEARTNGGFTAQLKYTPVGEIKDPVFKYNSRGQLVRIVKK